MNLECFPHDDGGYRIVAANRHGATAETALAADHPVSEYVTSRGRLNASFLRYWLTELDTDPNFLAFLNQSNDGFRPRRPRPEGWQDHNLSTGEVPTKPQKPGDVRVIGSHATGVAHGR